MVMPQWKRNLCDTILRLDRIPRYGRMYTYDKKTNSMSEAVWTFHRNGHWGVSILLRIGWLYTYLDQFNWLGQDRHIRRTFRKVYNSANWREDLKWRRRLGFWPKTTQNVVRLSTRRGPGCNCD